MVVRLLVRRVVARDYVRPSSLSLGAAFVEVTTRRRRMMEFLHGRVGRLWSIYIHFLHALLFTIFTLTVFRRQNS